MVPTLAATGSTGDTSATLPLNPPPASRPVLRFLIPPGLIDALQNAPVIAQNARNAGAVRRLETTYYDTGRQSLFASGLSLRVRRHGQRFRQRLIQFGSRQSLDRLVLSDVAVEDAFPDLSLLDAAARDGLPPGLLDSSDDDPLHAMFETRIRRRTRRLELSGAVVDVALDDGVIEAEARRESLAQVRLALQAGDPGILYDIGMRLLERVPLRLSTGSIVTRGFALAGNTAPRAEKAASLVLTPTVTIDEMIAAIFIACQTHLLANEPVAEDGRSPDGVHQMRVALRRARSAFSLLRREIPSVMLAELAREAKWAAGELGAAREWDVFLTSTLAEPARATRGRADFDGLRAAAEVPRAAGYASVAAMMGSDRYARFQLSMSHWVARRGWRNEVDQDGLGLLAEPAMTLAVRVLTRLHRKILKQGAHFRRLSANERHQVRITLKKLRYATEFFLPLFDSPGQARRHLRRIAQLQEALGLEQDAATTQPLLDRIGTSSKAPGVHQAIGMVTGWQARETIANGERLAREWQRFKALPRFWEKAAVLIAV